ncbi:MAG TPA: hemerythrin domain-containing protein [Candidatus Eisenbacteria bacterium]|nr:hemerythrin domain-containing protein [Candidatus Eisenbacteria bacterium]
MKITNALLAEHAVFHNLFDHMERMTPRLKTLGEVKVMAELLESLLEAHSHAEDDLVMEPLDHCLEQIGQRELFDEEHKTIDQSVRQAQSAKSAKLARKHLLGAVIASRKHFDKEERIIFPLAEKHLSERTLESLGKAWLKRREGAPGHKQAA